jgi:hypothetical protein
MLMLNPLGNEPTHVAPGLPLAQAHIRNVYNVQLQFNGHLSILPGSNGQVLVVISQGGGPTRYIENHVPWRRVGGFANSNNGVNQAEYYLVDFTVAWNRRFCKCKSCKIRRPCKHVILALSQLCVFEEDNEAFLRAGKLAGVRGGGGKKKKQ